MLKPRGLRFGTTRIVHLQHAGDEQKEAISDAATEQHSIVRGVDAAFGKHVRARICRVLSALSAGACANWPNCHLRHFVMYTGLLGGWEDEPTIFPGQQ
jgi:hypothetical protein